MKIRFGFVSNSSSASYYIPFSIYGTVFDVVRAIWEEKYAIYDKMDDEYDRDEIIAAKNAYAHHLAWLDYAIAIGIDPNASVMYPSISDTYIFRGDDGYYVETDWNEFNGIDGFVPLPESDPRSHHPKNMFFYMLAIGVTAREFFYDDPDPQHHCSNNHAKSQKLLLENNAIVCPICDIFRSKPNPLWIQVMENKFENKFYLPILRELYTLIGLKEPINRHILVDLSQRVSETVLQLTKKSKIVQPH